MAGTRWGRLVVAVYARSPHRLRRSVVRLATPGYRVGVLVVLRRPDGRVLLVDQPYVAGWALPGGDLKRHESLAEGAGRELREELGLELDVPTPVLAQQRSHDRWVTFVTAVDVPDHVAERVRVRSAELERVAWHDPDRLPPMHPDSGVPLALALGRELPAASGLPDAAA